MPTGGDGAARGGSSDDGVARGGVVVVDKPAGMTSHDVVARVRRLAGTRRVGHAGTLDPMATGVLIVGIGRATRLLGHLALHDKDYEATIRLGSTTASDDADGEVLAVTPVEGVDDDAIRAAAGHLVGDIEQRPPAVSAIKVDGRRAYARARAGEDVVLATRRVTVERFEVRDVRRGDGVIDVDALVRCSSGTYVRALARDVGAALGVGGHLVGLRRTRVGAFGIDSARTLDQLAESFDVVSLDVVAAAGFPRRDLDADDAQRVIHGVKLPASAVEGVVAAFGPTGEFLALLENSDGVARSRAVFVG
jgi:tRNA pseudouridine55 synthase